MTKFSHLFERILAVAFTALITAHAQFLADRHLTAMQWCVQAVLWCTHCTVVDNAAIYTKTTDFQLPLRFYKCEVTFLMTLKDQPWKSSWMSHKIIILVLATLTIENGQLYQDSIQANKYGSMFQKYKCTQCTELKLVLLVLSYCTSVKDISKLVPNMIESERLTFERWKVNFNLITDRQREGHLDS